MKIIILFVVIILLGLVAGFFLGAAATRRDCDQQIKDIQRWTK